MSVNEQENLETKKQNLDDSISGELDEVRDVLEGDEVENVIKKEQTGKAEEEVESAVSGDSVEATEDQNAAIDPLADLQAEVEKWKDLALRTAAEFDNFRKRSAREIQEARAYGNVDLLRSLLPVLDNFEMGLEAARAENEKSMIYMGMAMVKKQLADFLKDQNVEELTPEVGSPFDHNLQDAVSQEVSAEIPEGNVVRVLRRGFKLKDRLLRPATVVVSSGAGAAEQGNTQEG